MTTRLNSELYPELFPRRSIDATPLLSCALNYQIDPVRYPNMRPRRWHLHHLFLETQSFPTSQRF
jgi:hypothetical protein